MQAVKKRARPRFVLAGYGPPPKTGWQRLLRLTGITYLSAIYGILLALLSPGLLLPLLAPLALFSFVIIWMLPDTETPPTTLLFGLMWGFLGAQLIWPDYVALGLEGLPWITALRLFTFPLLLIFLISLSVSPTIRSELAKILNSTPMVWKLLVGFMGLALLSIGYSTNVSVSIEKYVVASLYWTLIFFVSAYVFAQPGRAIALSWLLWGVVLLLCVMGVWEERISQVPWAGHIPSFLALQDESVQRILTGSARAATGVYRVQSKFTTSLGFAEFFALATPFVLHFMLTSRSWLIRIAAAATLPLIFYCVIATDARSGVVGFLLTFLFYLFFWGYRRRSSDKQSLIGTAIVVAYPSVLIAFLASTMVVPQVSSMVWGSGAEQASTNARQEQYATGIPMVIKRPWGYGLGRGASQLGFTNQAGVATIDTYVLAIALEVGIPGLICYFGAFIVALYAGVVAVQRARDRETLLLIPLTIALANFLVIKTILSQLDNHPLVFALLGATVALIYRVQMQYPAGNKRSDSDAANGDDGHPHQNGPVLKKIRS